MRVICSWRLFPLVFEELVLVGSLFCGMSDMTRGRSFRLVWWWQLGLVHAMMLDIEHDLDAPKKYPQKDPDKTESTIPSTIQYI